jgi:lipocalin
MSVKLITYSIFMVFLFSLCSSKKENLEVVDRVDLEQYTGTWYEIARLPNRFEKGLKCVTATYKFREDGKISVINRGHKIENPGLTEKAEGWARVPDKDVPGKLKVTFFWPFFGKYWILELDENYQYALVGSPSRKYLWILSREKEMDPSTYKELIRKAEGMGFNTSKMIETEQDCNN